MTMLNADALDVVLFQVASLQSEAVRIDILPVHDAMEDTSTRIAVQLQDAES